MKCQSQLWEEGMPMEIISFPITAGPAQPWVTSSRVSNKNVVNIIESELKAAYLN